MASASFVVGTSTFKDGIWAPLPTTWKQPEECLTALLKMGNKSPQQFEEWGNWTGVAPPAVRKCYPSQAQSDAPAPFNPTYSPGACPDRYRPVWGALNTKPARTTTVLGAATTKMVEVDTIVKCCPLDFTYTKNNCCERSSTQALILAEITWALTTRPPRTIDSFTFAQTTSIVYQTGIRTLGPNHIISALAIEVRYQSTDLAIADLYAQLFSEATATTPSAISAPRHNARISLEAGAIAGIAVGLLVVLIAPLVACVFLIRKRHKRITAQLVANQGAETKDTAT